MKAMLLAACLLPALNSSAQLENQRTDTVRISGNCGMCERTIEKAGSEKGVSAVDWDMDSGIAVVSYDSTRTTIDAILQRVADAGYDNERFRAPDKVYDNLHGCCQYDRAALPSEAKEGPDTPEKSE